MEFERSGASILLFSDSSTLPSPESVDIYWDPGAGRGAPPTVFKQCRKPFVATFHGAAHMSLPLWECFGIDIRKIWAGRKARKSTTHRWRGMLDYISAIITVSTYAKNEFANFTGFTSEKIFSIYHGVDLSVFMPSDERLNVDKEPFILHVSSYQPLKNTERIISAYKRIRCPKPKLRMIVPGFPYSIEDKDIDIVKEPLGYDHLAKLYRDALCFIFPSLRETFGMPILEAMASGCPVITSYSTACAEVAGDAAMLVNPRSTKEIATAIEIMIKDENIRTSYRLKGLDQAQQFSWRRSSNEHLKVFYMVLQSYNA